MLRSGQGSPWDAGEQLRLWDATDVRGNVRDGQNHASAELASLERVKPLCPRSPEVDACSLS